MLLLTSPENPCSVLEYSQSDNRIYSICRGRCHFKSNRYRPVALIDVLYQSPLYAVHCPYCFVLGWELELEGW